MVFLASLDFPIIWVGRKESLYQACLVNSRVTQLRIQVLFTLIFIESYALSFHNVVRCFVSSFEFGNFSKANTSFLNQISLIYYNS